MTMDDMELVREYARSGSEAAFAALVSQHVNHVYSTALRQVRDAHLAQEITQSVFIILARKAGKLSPNTALGGWLYKTTRYAAAKAITMRVRRESREQQAFMEGSLNETDSSHTWRQIEPLLDNAIAELPAKDRDAVVLRFFQGKSFRDASAALGTTEAGAKMRVSRALEKLRRFFAQRGVTLTVGMIAGAVSTHSVQAAPAGLGSAATLLAMGGGAAASSTLPLVEATLKFMAYTKIKTTVFITAIVLAVGGGGAALVHRSSASTETAPKAFPGYRTPEATLGSLIWAMNKADKAMFAAGCTPEEGARFLKRMETKTPADFKREAAAIAQAFSSFKIARKEIISETEVKLHVRALAADENTPAGDTNPVMLMKKVGSDWKYDGESR